MAWNIGEKIFWGVIALMIIMTNPPVLLWINNYSKTNLLTAGVPTLWLWLEIWFLIGTLAFFLVAWKLPRWQKHEEIDVDQIEFPREVPE